ncbi:hypothetical protein ACIRRA_37250 [Nocardia sp. NPDC101769]|uniref:hypothetical protein n=1 Tax=Nocardia sp. NPDC101769 TaxID=3364333 RepID=UPI00382E5B4C
MSSPVPGASRRSTRDGVHYRGGFQLSTGSGLRSSALLVDSRIAVSHTSVAAGGQLGDGADDS